MSKKPNRDQSLTQTEFGKRVGLSQGRVSQLVREGLPVEPYGRIDLAKGEAWIARHLDPERRGIGKAAMAGGHGSRQLSLADTRAAHIQSRLRLNMLEIREREGRLIERDAVRQALFERARFERDAWIGFAQRAAAVVASETGADAGAVFAALDRLVRDQLTVLAATPVPFADEPAA